LPLAAELRPLCVGKEDVGEAVESHDSGLLHAVGTIVVPISAVCTLSFSLLTSLTLELQDSAQLQDSESKQGNVLCDVI